MIQVAVAAVAAAVFTLVLALIVRQSVTVMNQLTYDALMEDLASG